MALRLKQEILFRGEDESGVITRYVGSDICKVKRGTPQHAQNLRNLMLSLPLTDVWRTTILRYNLFPQSVTKKCASIHNVFWENLWTSSRKTIRKKTANGISKSWEDIRILESILELQRLLRKKILKEARGIEVKKWDWKKKRGDDFVCFISLLCVRVKN